VTWASHSFDWRTSWRTRMVSARKVSIHVYLTHPSTHTKLVCPDFQANRDSGVITESARRHVAPLFRKCCCSSRSSIRAVRATRCFFAPGATRVPTASYTSMLKAPVRSAAAAAKFHPAAAAPRPGRRRTRPRVLLLILAKNVLAGFHACRLIGAADLFAPPPPGSTI